MFSQPDIFREELCAKCQMRIVIHKDAARKDSYLCPRCLVPCFDEPATYADTYERMLQEAGAAIGEKDADARLEKLREMAARARDPWGTLKQRLVEIGFPEKLAISSVGDMINTGHPPERFREFPAEMEALLRDKSMIIADGELCLTPKGQKYLTDKQLRLRGDGK